ncbi:EamA family transporter [Cupriavidus basilensis]
MVEGGVALGVLNIGLFQAMLFIAAYRLPGGVAATVGAIQPLLVVLLAWLLLGARPHLAAWLAGLGGIGGVALLVLGPAARLDAVGVAAAAAGAVSMALGTVLAKRWRPPVSPAGAHGLAAHRRAPCSCCRSRWPSKPCRRA